MSATVKLAKNEILVNTRTIRDQVQAFKKGAGKVTVCHFNNFNLEMKGVWVSKVFEIIERTSEEDVRAMFHKEGFMPAEPEHMMAQVYSFYQTMYGIDDGNSNWCLISLGPESGEKALMLSSRKGAITKLSEFGTAPWEWDGYFSAGTYLLAVKRKNS